MSTRNKWECDCGVRNKAKRYCCHACGLSKADRVGREKAMEIEDMGERHALARAAQELDLRAASSHL